MRVEHVELTAYESLPPGDPIWHTATVPLQPQGAHTFLAWVTIGYIDGQGSGPWDFDNTIAAEIYQVDGSVVPYDTWGSKLGPEGALTNLHQISYVGFGSSITFRLRVWQTEEMAVAIRGIILYDL
jgi:hypothetical protein